MTLSFWRDKCFNVEKSAESDTAVYDLGPVKAGIAVRIPMRLANWLHKQNAGRAEREEIEQELAVQNYRRRV